MIKATRHFLVLMFWVLGGGMMLAAGEPPFRVLLLLSGLSFVAITTDRTLASSRARQGKPDDFSLTVADVANLSRRDWRHLVLSSVVGLGLAMAALLAFRGGV
jgi:hypothetical protein